MSCRFCLTWADLRSALPSSPLPESLEDLPLTVELTVPEALKAVPFHGCRACLFCGAWWWQYDLQYWRCWREVSPEARYHLQFRSYAVVRIDTGQLIPLLPNDPLIYALAHVSEPVQQPVKQKETIS